MSGQLTDSMLLEIANKIPPSSLRGFANSLSIIDPAINDRTRIKRNRKGKQEVENTKWKSKAHTREVILFQ